MNHLNLYQKWQANTKDDSLLAEISSIKSDDAAIYERFFTDLEFGTGGIRGIMGVGTNRMNVHTVGRIAYGLARHIKNGKIAIAYDSRHNSQKFAYHAAAVMATNGIVVHIFEDLAATPLLSYAVRHLNCNAGIMLTASHNPKDYNGLKAYGADGCQLGLNESEKVIEIINSTDIFDVAAQDFEVLKSQGKINFISKDLIESYYNEVLAMQVKPQILQSTNLKVVYTPLNGTGLKPICDIFKKAGLFNIAVVAEQANPDGSFATCEYPNPESEAAFALAIRDGKQLNADILIATDPDADRTGVMFLHKNEYKMLTGNQAGVLMLDYILTHKIVQNPVAIKTIVTTKLADLVAAKHNCEIIDVLTGFKFIGEQIALLESKGEINRYILGFEESYGYLLGTYARDKDAISAALMLAEIAAFYKDLNMTLFDALEKIYNEHGFFFETQLNIAFSGADSMQKMREVMQNLRQNPLKDLAGESVTKAVDYNTDGTNLPKSDVLEFATKNASVIARPSGTEPKIKVYISAKAADEQTTKSFLEKIKAEMNAIFN